MILLYNHMFFESCSRCIYRSETTFLPFSFFFSFLLTFYRSIYLFFFLLFSTPLYSHASFVSPDIPPPSIPPFSFLSVGMGGSSVLAAAVLSAVSTLLGSKLDKERLIHLVSQVEQGSGNGSGSDGLLICYL